MATNMNIIVKLLFGKSFTLDVDQSDTLEDIKTKIGGKRFSSDPYDLLFNGEQLVDGKKLLEYNISDGCTIELVWKQAVDDDVDAEITRILYRKTRFSKDFLSRHNETSSFSAVNNSSGYVSGYVDTTYNYENRGQHFNGPNDTTYCLEEPRGTNSLMNNLTFASRSCVNLTCLNDDSEDYAVSRASAGGDTSKDKETIAFADKVNSVVQKSEVENAVTNDAAAEISQIYDAKIDEKNQEISVLQDEKERLATENAALTAEIDQMRNQRSCNGDLEQSSIVEAPRKSNVFMNNISSFVHSGNDITSLDDGYGSTRFSQSFAGGNSFASKEKTGPSNKLDSILEHSDVGDKVNVDSGVEKSIPSKNEQENQENVSPPSEDAGNGNEESYADISFNNVTINNDDNESEKFNDSVISHPFVRQNVNNGGRSLLDYSVHTISDSTFNGTITLGDTPVIPDTPAFRKRTKHDLRNLFLQNAVKSENVNHSGSERFNDSVTSFGDSVRHNVNNAYSALDYSVFTTSDSPNNGILGDTPILPDTPGFRRRTQQQPYDLTPAFRSRNVNRGERREPFIDEESFISKEDPYDLDYQINTPATTVDISDDERSFETDDELPSRPWNSPMIRGIRCYCTTGCEKEICNCLKHGVNCNINCHPRFDCYNGFVLR